MKNLSYTAPAQVYLELRDVISQMNKKSCTTEGQRERRGRKTKKQIRISPYTIVNYSQHEIDVFLSIA